jgi:nanoRNase/pAp phosphatase (c-di-AMP/oligoRNAs hydrolase)
VGQALTALRKHDELAVAYVGRLDRRTAHVLPNLADFCLAIEGVTWSAAGGLVEDELAVNIRRSGSGMGAGDLARAMAEEEGLGGGHHAMARVAFRVQAAGTFSEEPGDPDTVGWLMRRVTDGLEALRAVR